MTDVPFHCRLPRILLLVVLATYARYDATAQSTAGNPSFTTPSDLNLLTHDFGLVLLGAPTSIEIDIYNLGSHLSGAPITLQDVSAIGDFQEFTLLHAPIVGVIAGDDARVLLEFDATGTGEFAVNFLLTFSSDGVPDAPAQLLTINAFAEVVLGGDFDQDDDVDGADFLAWQRGVGIMSGADLAQGDANRDGAVNQLDLSTWRAYFGMATSATELSSVAVPEPATRIIVALGLVMMNCVSHRIKLPTN